jgi:hypothetical protein
MLMCPWWSRGFDVDSAAPVESIGGRGGENNNLTCGLSYFVNVNAIH